MTDVEYTVAHTASLREHPAIQTVTYAAATGAGAEEKHYVPTRVDYTDEQLAALSGDLGQQFSRFELIRAGKKVKSLTIGSGEKLSGVHVAFEDGAEKVAGVSPVVSTGGGNAKARSITFHEDELVTTCENYVVEFAKPREINGVKIDVTKMLAGLALQTNFGQRYLAASIPMIFVPKFGKTYLDKEIGALAGVYGIAAADALVSLGLILLPMQDVVEYRFLDVKYDLDAFQCVGERMLSLKEQTVINDSDATVTSQVKFAHSYTVTSNFTNTHGLKAGVKTDIKAGLPFLAEGKVEVSGEYSCQFAWGKGVSDAKTDEWTAIVSAPPRSRLRGRATVTESTIDVPYTADLLITKIDGSTETVKGTSGTYRGVNVSDFRVDIEQMPG